MIMCAQRTQQQVTLTDIILLSILSTSLHIQWNIWGVPLAEASSQLLQLICLVIRFNCVHLPTLGPGLDRYIRNKHGHHRSFQILLYMLYCKEVNKVACAYICRGQGTHFFKYFYAETTIVFRAANLARINNKEYPLQNINSSKTFPPRKYFMSKPYNLRLNYLFSKW